MKKATAPIMAKTKSPIKFLKQVRAELKIVDWPSRDQAIKLTSIVVAASLLVGIYLGALDALFTYWLTFLVK